MSYIIRLALAALIAAVCFAQDTGSATFAPFEVTVQVDRVMCGTGDVNCGSNSSDGNGHTYEAAGRTNHNPVTLIVQVLSDGQPVTGLTPSDVTLVSSYQVIPAGAAFLTAQTDCGSDAGLRPCFVDFGQGMYFLRVHPFPSTGLNWKAGTYIFQVRVRYTQSHPKQGVIVKDSRALARIDIPF